MCQFSENGPPKVIGANFQPSYLRAQEELGRKQGIYDYLHTQRSRVNQVLNYFVQFKNKIIPCVKKHRVSGKYREQLSGRPLKMIIFDI